LTNTGTDFSTLLDFIVDSKPKSFLFWLIWVRFLYFILMMLNYFARMAVHYRTFRIWKLRTLE